jgi:hypothetical protein
MKAGALRRRLSSIAVAHELADHPNPTEDAVVRTTWKGFRRTLGSAQRGKDPILTADLRAIIALLPVSMSGTAITGSPETRAQQQPDLSPTG